MTSSPWQEDWFDAGLQYASTRLWRGVDAQHQVPTMRLVDTLEEQAELERLLETSKPPMPAEATHLHPLLNTPFRYRSWHSSRFRQPGEAGIWYGAEELHTSCTEVAYWRWRFLMDSAGLRDGELITEHTFFQAQAAGRVIDLRRPPWQASATHWTQRHDYAACQAVAKAARQHEVQWILYRSVRVDSGTCGAVLDPVCLSLVDGVGRQTWVSKVTASRALMLHGDDRLTVVLED